MAADTKEGKKHLGQKNRYVCPSIVKPPLKTIFLPFIFLSLIRVIRTIRGCPFCEPRNQRKTRKRERPRIIADERKFLFCPLLPEHK
jgi:hypothetical protein